MAENVPDTNLDMAAEQASDVAQEPMPIPIVFLDPDHLMTRITIETTMKRSIKTSRVSFNVLSQIRNSAEGAIDSDDRTIELRWMLRALPGVTHTSEFEVVVRGVRGVEFGSADCVLIDGDCLRFAKNGINAFLTYASKSDMANQRARQAAKGPEAEIQKQKALDIMFERDREKQEGEKSEDREHNKDQYSSSGQQGSSIVPKK